MKRRSTTPLEYLNTMGTSNQNQDELLSLIEDIKKIKLRLYDRCIKRRSESFDRIHQIGQAFDSIIAHLEEIHGRQEKDDKSS